jgi:ferredoxin
LKPKKGATMKITIDKNLCASEKRCFNLYPEIFTEDAKGKGEVRNGGVLVSEDDETDAQSAANACPKGAIIIEY